MSTRRHRFSKPAQHKFLGTLQLAVGSVPVFFIFVLLFIDTWNFISLFYALLLWGPVRTDSVKCVYAFCWIVLSLWGLVITDSGKCVHEMFRQCLLCEVWSSLQWEVYTCTLLGGSAFFVRSGPHWEWEVCVSTLYQLVLSLWGLVLTNGGVCVYLFYIS